MEKTMKWIAAAAGAAAGLLTRMPTALRLLVLLMALDYLSGVGVALLGKSPKSEGGALSSRAGFAGLARKAMILVIVLLAAVLDQLTGSAACTGAATMFYIVNESLSILENAVLLGVPVPQRLRQALDVARLAAEGKKQGRLNVAGVRWPPHPAPAARRKLFSKKGLTNPAGFRIIYTLHRWCTK